MAKRSKRSATRRPAPRQKAVEPVNLAEEYRYVTEDLKRIGIISNFDIRSQKSTKS